MEFDRNNREEILYALAEGNNALAFAVCDRIREFAKSLLEMAERNRRWPTELPLYEPETAFDEIVIHFTLEAIRDVLRRDIRVRWVTRENAA